MQKASRLIIVLILTVFFYIDRWQTPLLAAGHPEFVLASASLDMGRIPQKDTITHKIRFKNEGTVPLIIEKIKPG